jgi:hypothetical protein
MAYKVHSTKDYHVGGLETLGWELTVCNALHPESSPLRKILRRDASYGALLSDHLRRFIPMETVKSVLEVGGGYGWLMKDLLERNNFQEITMLDLSPVLLQIQRETLKDHSVDFLEEDFLETDPSRLKRFDAAILNENLGDLPAITGLDPDDLKGPAAGLDEPLTRVKNLCRRYKLERPETVPFNLNLGALVAVEKLCGAGIPYIFLSEHSCEAAVPEPYRSLIRVSSPLNPERIILKGHDEYSIKFSHLEAVGRAFSYVSLRGPLADFIPFDFSPRLRFILASHSVEKDEYEIIRHFISDLYQYEYLLLIKAGPGAGRDIECLRCGKCCLNDFIAYTTEDDIERWRREGRSDILAVIEREHAVWAGDHLVSSEDGRYIRGCPFLIWEGNRRACAIYETRPGVCQRFVPGSSELCARFSGPS